MKWPWSKAASAPEVLDDNGIRHALEHRLLQYACLYQGRQGVGRLRNIEGLSTDLYVRINGSMPMAYVHGWSLYPGNKVALVGHFAVEKDLVGKGFGEALARGFANALRQEFGTEQIVFSERSYSASHEKLFKRLGAQPQERREYPGCPDWVWAVPDGLAV
ncbi:hypothetical protein [uncultured Xanthomonas sp.]|uniref:hypothetical protein n=1 Tax=uncultured Xanthomonas sp. TaxID=152831 RepID=UPI0025CDB961|nr:hypothetical protein [uncultured Xanthomonas sp.]